MTGHRFYERKIEGMNRMSTANGTQTQYQTIWLHSGQPLEVQLRDPEGIAKEGPTGRPCVEFALMDGRIFRATPNQASQVRKTKPIQGDWLRILMAKSEAPGANYGKNLTTAERISAPPQTQQSTQQPPAPVSPIPIRGAHQENMTRLGEVLIRGLPPSYPDDPGPSNAYLPNGNGAPPKPPQNGSGHQNGNGHVPPNPTPASAWVMTGHGQAILAHYIQAIDLAVAVKKYAKAVELDIGPVAFEDIRAIAACSRIDAQKREGIR